MVIYPDTIREKNTKQTSSRLLVRGMLVGMLPLQACNSGYQDCYMFGLGDPFQKENYSTLDGD